MQGILLCLNREQRLIYILGEIFELTDTLAAEALDISRVNYRKKLSVARRQISNFMNNRCGLIKKSNSCQCARKTASLIRNGEVDPYHLKFSSDHLQRVRNMTPQKINRLDDLLANQCRDLFQTHPYYAPPDFAESLNQFIQLDEFRTIFNMN